MESERDMRRRELAQQEERDAREHAQQADQRARDREHETMLQRERLAAEKTSEERKLVADQFSEERNLRLETTKLFTEVYKAAAANNSPVDMNIQNALPKRQKWRQQPFAIPLSMSLFAIHLSM